MSLASSGHRPRRVLSTVLYSTVLLWILRIATSSSRAAPRRANFHLTIRIESCRAVPPPNLLAQLMCSSFRVFSSRDFPPHKCSTNVLHCIELQRSLILRSLFHSILRGSALDLRYGEVRT